MLKLLKEPYSLLDAISLFRKALRYNRLKNALQVYSSFKKSSRTGKVIMKGLPIAASFEPTTSCNLRCPQCPSGLRSFSRETGMAPIELYRSYIESNYKSLLYLLLYFQGEPYLHQQFFKMVRIAANRNIYTATSTNAHYLNQANSVSTVECGLDRIIISIDGITEESYKKYRVGGDLQKVLNGTKNLIAAKKQAKSNTPFIIWQFIVFKHNESEVEKVKQLGKKLGVNQVAIKTAQVYDEASAKNLLPTQAKYNRYEPGSLKIKGGLKNECWKMWHSCVITWDGKVVPCCFDKDATYQLGNLNNNTFPEIWNSKPYKVFRAQLWKGRKTIPICTNCSEGSKVWEF